MNTYKVALTKEERDQLIEIDRVKKRFVEEGLDSALKMAPTSRVYEKIVDGDMEAHLIALACGDPPKVLRDGLYGY
jgi:hypothetical protein